MASLTQWSVSDEIKPTIVAESDMRNASKTEESDVARAGSFITYKKKFANNEIYDNTLQPDRFPLRKAMEGHKVGDVIVFQGKEYEIIGL